MVVTTMAFFSCDKDDEEPVSTIESYVGTYSGTENWTNGGNSYSKNVTVTITKSSSANSLVLTFPFYGESETLSITLDSNNSFKTSFVEDYDGYTQTINVSGKFIYNSTINFSYTTEGYVTKIVNATKL